MMITKAAIVLNAFENDPLLSSAATSLTTRPHTAKINTDFVYAIEVF